MENIIKFNKYISEEVDYGDGRFYEGDSDVNQEENDKILAWTPPSSGDYTGLDNYKRKYFLLKTYGYEGKETLTPDEIKNFIRMPLMMHNGTIVTNRQAYHRNVFAGLTEEMGSGDLPACSCPKKKRPKKQKKMKWDKTIMAESKKQPKIYEKCGVCGGIRKKKNRKPIRLSDEMMK
jgi:hypothetical protein